MITIIYIIYKIFNYYLIVYIIEQHGTAAGHASSELLEQSKDWVCYGSHSRLRYWIHVWQLCCYQVCIIINSLNTVPEKMC